ncbi:MAG: glycosyltransferase [Nitrospirae bacterium]|nr:glycosyltransferase [Nitrospirota bacterium]
MKRLIKQITRELGMEISRYNQKDYLTRVVSLSPKTGHQGNVLLSYIIKPFLSNDYDEPCNPNQIPECFQIAQTFLDFGYSVDIINYQNSGFIPQKNYSFFIGLDTDLERIAPLLNKDCIKILEGLRLLEPNQSIKHADYIIMEGNEFTINTFKHGNKPIYRLPQVNPVFTPWVEGKDFENCRRNFLYLSGGGLVHKGLDLVLDAFSEMPDYHLYVCGPVQKEKDFARAYYKELYETPNIHTVGWVDVGSPKFVEIVNNCIGYVHPSSSECCSGSVISCTQAGLIPIASYESGVDLDRSFGVVLKDCSIDTIKNTVQRISGLPAEKLKEMSHKAWNFARINHTAERFAEEFKKVVTQIMEDHQNKNSNTMTFCCS